MNVIIYTFSNFKFIYISLNLINVKNTKKGFLFSMERTIVWIINNVVK